MLSLSSKQKSQTFTSYQKRWLKGYLSDTSEHRKESLELKTELAKIVEKVIFDEIVPKEILELYKKFSGVFYTTKNIEIDCHKIGIFPESHYYNEEISIISVSTNIYVQVERPIPIPTAYGRFEINELGSSKDCDVIRDLCDRFIKAEYLAEIENCNKSGVSVVDEIKTVGQLFNNHRDWFNAMIDYNILSFSESSDIELTQTEKEEYARETLTSLEKILEL